MISLFAMDVRIMYLPLLGTFEFIYQGNLLHDHYLNRYIVCKIFPKETFQSEALCVNVWFGKCDFLNSSFESSIMMMM